MPGGNCATGSSLDSFGVDQQCSPSIIVYPIYLINLIQHRYYNISFDFKFLHGVFVSQIASAEAAVEDDSMAGNEEPMDAGVAKTNLVGLVCTPRYCIFFFKNGHSLK